MDSKPEKTDVLIVGGGAAGLTAALYSARYGLKTTVISDYFGGIGGKAHRVCNYPGVHESGGFELMNKFKEHAESAGAQLVTDLVTEIKKTDFGFTVFTQQGESFQARAIVLALGTKKRKLGLAKEERFLGKGISYCFTCDGMFFKGKKVAVVGGGNAAVTAALYFSEISSKTYLIYRGDKLKAEAAWIDNLAHKRNVEVIYKTNVVDLYGKDRLEGLILDKSFSGSKKLSVDGLFIEIGEVPNQHFNKTLGLKTDKEGFVKVDEQAKTTVDGVWAAGDFTTGSAGFRQIVTAASEGAVAANSIFKYLKKE